MIIHQPSIQIKDDQVIVSSKIETKAQISIPPELWFKFPLEYLDAVTDRTEGFFISLFLLGMHLNEDIEIRGEVSPLLADNINLLMTKYLQETKNQLHRVNFNFENLNVADQGPHRNIKLSSFSAGSDSLYAFWSHHFPKISDHPINLTHGLFIHGFDILLQNKEVYQKLLSDYQGQFDEWGLSLISCATNVHSFYQFRVPWAYAHLPPLAGAATVLGNRVSEYIQPGNFEENQEDPITASSYIHLLSTETTKLSPHAIDLTRLQKIIKIMDWPPAQKNLRVCFKMNNKHGQIVCNRCNKCMSTSLLITMHDKWNNFENYNKKFTLGKYIYFCLQSGNVYAHKKTGYLEILKSKKRYDFLLVFWLILPINYIKWFVIKKMLPLLPKSWIFAVKNLVYQKQTSK